MVEGVEMLVMVGGSLEKDSSGHRKSRYGTVVHSRSESKARHWLCTCCVIGRHHSRGHQSVELQHTSGALSFEVDICTDRLGECAGGANCHTVGLLRRGRAWNRVVTAD